MSEGQIIAVQLRLNEAIMLGRDWHIVFTWLRNFDHQQYSLQRKTNLAEAVTQNHGKLYDEEGPIPTLSGIHFFLMEPNSDSRTEDH